jgi:hypothetical protein
MLTVGGYVLVLVDYSHAKLMLDLFGTGKSNEYLL